VTIGKPTSPNRNDIVDRDAAIERAAEAARRAGRRLEDYDEPRVDLVDGDWQITFSGTVPLPGNHFLVIVNDSTGAAALFAGH
jgi:hypothetical protein